MMAASPAGKHRRDRYAAQPRGGAASPGSTTAAAGQQPTRRRQPILRAGALSFGVATGAGNLLSVASGAAAVDGGAPTIVHRDDIELTDYTGTTSPTPSFDTSLHYLLDTMLGIGTKTLPQLITASDPNLTVGELLNMASPSTTVNTSLHLSSLLDVLGLNNITMTEVMDALNLAPTKTVDQILQTMGLANVDLDQLLTPLGIPSTQTLYGLADRMSLLNVTLQNFLNKIGPTTNANTEKVSDALDSIGLGGFYKKWFTGSTIGNPGLAYLCHGVKGTVEQALECVVTQYNNSNTQHPNITLKSNETIGYLLTHTYQFQSGSQNADFTKPLGAETIGQMMGFNNTTTVQQFVDKLMVNMNVTAGVTSGGIVNGTPVGNPVVTTVSPNSTSTEFSGKPGTVVVAPSDDSAQHTPVPLGSQTWGSVMSWFQVPPNESVADLIDRLWLNSTQLGQYTVGDALQGLVVNPGAIGNVPVTDSDTVDAFLQAIGFNTMTLDQLIGLT